MPTYLGPSDVLVYKDKIYRPGDNVPMDRDEVSHHMQFGHRFEGNDPSIATGVILGFTPKPVEAMPYDDRGQRIESAEDLKVTVTKADETGTKATTTRATNAPTPTTP